METEEPPKSAEVTFEDQSLNQHVLQSLYQKVSTVSLGFLQLGKFLTEKAVEVEAVRIFVPKAAITHDIPTKIAKLKSLGSHQEEVHPLPEVVTAPRKKLPEVKKLLERPKNSERRLLQDDKGLSKHLRVQTEINRELKKLLVASVGDDPQYITLNI
ncbi:golgin-45 [Sigmodon hispidus]